MGVRDCMKVALKHLGINTSRILIAGIALLGSFHGQAQAAVSTLGIDPAYSTAGTPFSVSVSLSNSAPVSSIQFNLAYDPSLLTLTGASLGTSTSSWSFYSNITQPGLARIGLFNTTANPSGTAQQVVVLNFTVKDPGHLVQATSPLTLNNVVLEGVALPAGQVYSGVYTKTTVDQAPVFNATGNKSVAVGTNLTFNVSATDPDGDPLIYSATHLPAGATFNAATQVFSWTPTAAQVPGDYATFNVTDTLLQAQQTVTITVTATTANYTLNIGSTNGTVVAKVGGVVTTATNFPAGTVVELTAAANTGYLFSSWLSS